MTGSTPPPSVPPSPLESAAGGPESPGGTTPPDRETDAVGIEKSQQGIQWACNVPHPSRVRTEGPAAGAPLRCKRFGKHDYHLFDNKVTEGTYCRTDVYIEVNHGD